MIDTSDLRKGLTFDLEAGSSRSSTFRITNKVAGRRR
jgi:hypothetical protein